MALAVAGLYVVRYAGSPRKLPSAANASSPSKANAEMRVGAVLPDFMLSPYKGDPLAASSLKAKVVLINFWATWCEACMVEMPSIVKLYQSYKDRGLDVVAVDLDTNPSAVLPHTLQKFGMVFNIYTDEDSKLADFFQVQAIPLSIVMDHDRKILLIENEGLDWDGSEFTSMLDKWLAG